MINSTAAPMSHDRGIGSLPESSAGGRGGGGGGGWPDSVTPNCCANACAIRSTPCANPAPYASRARYGVMASRMRPTRAPGRNPAAPRPVAMNTRPVPARWFFRGTSNTTPPRFLAGSPAAPLAPTPHWRPIWRATSEASDVALQIGRQWGVGAKGAAGDPAKNLGGVVLLVPLKNHRAGTGRVFIATGRGAAGFLPGARVGRIRDAMTPYLAREDYSAGLAHGVDLIAQAFAQQFGVTLSGQPPPPPTDHS